MRKNENYFIIAATGTSLKNRIPCFLLALFFDFGRFQPLSARNKPIPNSVRRLCFALLPFRSYSHNLTPRTSFSDPLTVPLSPSFSSTSQAALRFYAGECFRCERVCEGWRGEWVFNSLGPLRFGFGLRGGAPFHTPLSPVSVLRSDRGRRPSVQHSQHNTFRCVLFGSYSSLIATASKVIWREEGIWRISNLCSFSSF